MPQQQYTSSDIKLLSDKEHVRLRLPVYAGNTKTTTYNIPLFKKNKLEIKSISFVPAVYRCVGEILDNSTDEFSQTTINNPTITIEANPFLGTYTISDNGRGVPIDKHVSGKFTPEVVFGSLRSGRNFTKNKKAGVIGMNGMGSSITCFCSVEFRVEIKRDKKRYVQTFNNGAQQISKPYIRSHSGNLTGTTISFQLDNSVFENTSLPPEMMENRAIELALTNPGITVKYNKNTYKFKRGFEDIIKQISNNYFKFKHNNLEFFVVFDVNESLDEQIFSWVNSSLLFDGGLCNTQFLNSFYDKTIKHLFKEAKKAKCEVTKNDVRNRLLVFGNLCISDPEYDAQSKTRLTGPTLKKDINEMIDGQWDVFQRKHKKWFNSVLERSMVRHNIQSDKKAVKEHQKKLKKKVQGLIDATSSNRWETQLLVTEGLSAASMITQARNPKIHASYPLTGKINNVYDSTISQVLKMGKITDLITAIGLIPGKKALRSELNYGKLIIATDSDPDGDDIFTLLVNLFYQFWPELFDPNYDPFIYRLIAPNVCAVKGTKRIHFPNQLEYQKAKHKYKTGWTINYYKGLGSMTQIDWEMILSGKTDTLVPILDDGKIKETLQLLFGPDAEARRNWLKT